MYCGAEKLQVAPPPVKQAVIVPLPVAEGALKHTGALAAMVMLKACVASRALPLVAVTVPLNVPAVVGVPLMTPAALKVKPGGKAPVVRLKVGAPVEV